MKYKIQTIILIILFLYIGTLNVFAKDTAQSSIVLETNTGRILYKNNPNKRMLIASITKIMTAVIVIENAKLTEKVKIGSEILTMYGTNLYLDVGEIMTVKDLLYGLILRSGNDAAISLAYYVGGTEEEFVNMMNYKAKELGMNNTSFSNSHGLDDYTQNYSTAYDMALLSVYASKNKTYNKISQTKKHSASSDRKTYLWYNRNKLLKEYEYCTGGKNGYTPDAGKTLVTTAKKDSLNLTITSLNDPDCYNNHKRIYTTLFNQYQKYTIVQKESKYSIGTQKYIAQEEFSYPLTKKERQLITTEIITNNKKQIIIKLSGKEIGRVKLVEDIKKKEAKTLQKGIAYLFEILKKFILGLQNNLNPGPLVPKPLEIYKCESSIL